MIHGPTEEPHLEEGSGVAGEGAKRKGGHSAKGKRGARGSCGGQGVARDGRRSEGDSVRSAGGGLRTQIR